MLIEGQSYTHSHIKNGRIQAIRGVAQLVEHTAGGRVVARSNRVAPT